ncbi:MAG: hypothetical protein ACTH29_03005 [Fusobacterium sp.]
MINFFGNLAGATGGLIGVISAFLISKILNREEKFERLEKERKNTLIKMETYLRKIIALGLEEKLIEIKNDELKKLSEDYDVINPKGSSDIFCEEFSVYHDKNEIISEIEKVIKEKEKLSSLESIEIYFLSLDIPNKFKKITMDKINAFIVTMFCEKIDIVIDKDYPKMKTVDEYYKKINIPYDAENDLEKSLKDYIFRKLEKIDSPMEKMKRQVLNSTSIYRNLLESGLYNISKSISSGSSLMDFSSNYPKLRISYLNWNVLEELDNLRGNIEELTKYNELLYSDLKSFNYDYKNINFFIFIILLFFFTGVIYPLSYTKYFLTDSLNYSFDNFFYELFSISGRILLVVTLIFLLFIGRIIQINIRAHFNKEKLEELNKTCNILNYCDFFKNYYQNTLRDDYFAIKTKERL